MVTTEPPQPEDRRLARAPAPAAVVEVAESKYIELLISRRKLERVGNGRGLLVDLETHETFALNARFEAWLARGA